MSPREDNPRLERVGYELRAAGVKSEETNPLRSGIHTRGYLPHVKREGARYFVTFRLADSLPKEVLLGIQAERAERLTRFYAQQDAAKRLARTALNQVRWRRLSRTITASWNTTWTGVAESAGCAGPRLRMWWPTPSAISWENVIN
jgi:hypothetical protein